MSIFADQMIDLQQLVDRPIIAGVIGRRSSHFVGVVDGLSFEVEGSLLPRKQASSRFQDLHAGILKLSNSNSKGGIR